MIHRPVAIAFDVIETLFSLETLRPRLQALGLPGQSLELWFAEMLRDAFALTATDSYKTFKEVASGTLSVMLSDRGLSVSASRVEHMLKGFAELSQHQDVLPAFARLHDHGIRIATLTNGSADTTRTLLEKAGLIGYVEYIISIEEIRVWKPRKQVYLHAAHVLHVKPQELALVAAHAWDCHGAKQAGLATGWVQRGGTRFQPVMSSPNVSGKTLLEVCDGLFGLTAKGLS